MDCGKLWKTILDGVVVMLIVVVLIIIVAVCSGCGKIEPPYQYSNRMKYAGASPNSELNLYVWIDTETGVCYVGNGKGSTLTVLVDHDGRPYIANGWRDYNE